MSTIRLAVHSSIYNCELELKHRINIIKGDSGIGKTTLVGMLRSENETIIKESTYPFSIADASNYKNILISAKNQIVIFDDVKLVETEDFIDLITKNLIDHNLYLILIVRAIIPKMFNISYSIHAIYEMYYDETLVNHYIRELYKPKIESIYTLLAKDEPICLITEDTGAGYRFFKALANNTDKVFPSTSGCSTVLQDSLDKVSNYNVIAIIDTAGYGCHIEEFTSRIEDLTHTVTLLYDLECFEEVLVRSNLLKEESIVEHELSNLPTFANKFKSWENYFQDLLNRATINTRWHMSHKSRKPKDCYIKDCDICNKYISEYCTKFKSGDKFEVLLKGTKFEYLLKLRKPKDKKEKAESGNSGITSFFS